MIMKKIYMKPVLNVEKAQPESIICTSTVSGNVGMNYEDGADELPRVKELVGDNDDDTWDEDW